jgi:hypothetical protein
MHILIIFTFCDRGICTKLIFYFTVIHVLSDQMVLVIGRQGSCTARAVAKSNPSGATRLDSTQVRCSCGRQAGGWTTLMVAKDAQMKVRKNYR